MRFGKERVCVAPRIAQQVDEIDVDVRKRIEEVGMRGRLGRIHHDPTFLRRPDCAVQAPDRVGILGTTAGVGDCGSRPGERESRQVPSSVLILLHPA